MNRVNSAFLRLSTSPADWNARQTYLELIRIPTSDDIITVVRNEIAARWTLGDAGIRRRGLEDDGKRYTIMDVHRDYTCWLRQLRNATAEFRAYGFQDIARAIERADDEDEDGVDTILQIRKHYGIPTRDEIEYDSHGLILAYHQGSTVADTREGAAVLVSLDAHFIRTLSG